MTGQQMGGPSKRSVNKNNQKDMGDDGHCDTNENPSTSQSSCCGNSDCKLF